MKIYIATHKKFKKPKIDVYCPIQVGAKINKKIGYLRDDKKDNISEKNSNYCELTAMYWIWKNDKSDIVGLTHYRRYFFRRKFINKYYNLLDEKDIRKMLINCDIIVPKPHYYYKKSILKAYSIIHNKNDLMECRKIIEKKYPDYLASFDNVMKKKKIYCYNMLITNKEIFDLYCSWLFDILFALEKTINISNYDNYNKRLYGFLSERLFNVWLEKNNKYKIKEVNVYNTEDNMLKYNIIYIIKKICYYLGI